MLNNDTRMQYLFGGQSLKMLQVEYGDETSGLSSNKDGKSKMSGQKLLKMYNLNVNVATTLPVGFLGLDGQSNTPRTPEIVNSLVAMTNPFDALMKPGRDNCSPGSEESCSGTGSPLGSPNSSPPSVQHTRSQLIKEGLKLTIQTKRKQSGSDTKEDVQEFESKRTKREELTEEDEERRKRRRERNKIAATKCRMKKREKTANLVTESEVLETQNIDLKTQIQDLQKQLKNLMDILSMHSGTCVRPTPVPVPSQPFEDLPEAFSDGYDPRPDFGPQTPEAFEVGSTNGTAMNPYGKDPNFAKLLDDPTSSNNYSRSFGKAFSPGAFLNSSTNCNLTRNKSPLNGKTSENRFEYPSDKKSTKDKALNVRAAQKKLSVFSEEEDVFRRSFHCAHDDDADSYKPNGIIDGNFFANRTDIFATGNEYVGAFGSNPLDNGCLA